MSNLPTILIPPPGKKSSLIPKLTAEELVDICRGSEIDDGASYLEEISTQLEVDGLKTLVRWRRIAHDATLNQPSVAKLARKLISLVVDFACTREEALAARQKFDETGSTEAFSQLHEKACNLFTRSKTTGEPGEILLYMLAERVLKRPQILCKFPHKTNPDMHAHGADGVHASVHPETNHLNLHWGEAKFVADVNQGLDQCFKSLAELILEPEGAKKTKNRDIELIRDHISLNNPPLEDAILRYLTDDDPLSNAVHFSGMAVVGFNHKEYSQLGEAITKNDKAAVQQYIAEWTAIVSTKAKDYALAGIEIDLFCIPCQSVADFRKEFLRILGVTDGNVENS